MPSNITPEKIEAAEKALAEVLQNYHYVMPVDGMMTVLSAALSAQPVVKALEWVKHPTADLWRAHTILGVYQVHAFKIPGWSFDGHDGTKTSASAYDNDAAKAAAQADYSARILSALTTPPAPASSEPVALDDLASLIPDEVELPQMTERGYAGQVMDAAWPIAGGNHQPYEFWHAVAFGAQLTLKMFPPAPTVDGWTVPEGWQLVPKEPTEAMLDALHDDIRIKCDPSDRSAWILNDREMWSAMLAAAPTPPKEGSENG